jgi:hypothetical protein
MRSEQPLNCVFRSAGIKIITKDEQNWDTADLFVHMFSATQGSLFAGATTAEFEQVVVLPRQQSHAVVATWSQSYCWLASSHLVRPQALEAVNRVTDDFANDYLAANPKR